MDHDVKFKRVQNEKLARLNKMFGRSVRVSRHDYTIVWCIGLAHPQFPPIQGLCNTEDKVIYIDVEDCSEQDIQESLLHEICHAEVFEAGLRQRMDHDANLEEQTVELIAKGLSSAFKIRSRK